MADMPVGKLIFTMSWPAIISMFIQAFYNVVDSFFVSLISEQALGGGDLHIPDPDAYHIGSGGNRRGYKLADFQKAGCEAL